MSGYISKIPLLTAAIAVVIAWACVAEATPARPPRTPPPAPITPKFNQAARPPAGGNSPRPYQVLKPKSLPGPAAPDLGGSRRPSPQAILPRVPKQQPMATTLPRPLAPKPKIEGPTRWSLPPVALGQKKTLTPTFNKNANPGTGGQTSGSRPPTTGQGGSFKLGEGGKLKPIFNKSAGTN